MKSSKMNSLTRLLSFVLIAVLLICTVGFAADGWQSDPNNEPDSGENGDKADKTDENTDGDNNSSTTPPTSNKTDTENEDNNEQNNENNTDHIEPVKYYNNATGLETTEEISKALPIGFVLNPSMPLYGISNADITLEFPIEDGSTRLLSYTTNPSMLWKVGALSPTRSFISSSSNFFGGIVVSYGNDDIVKYSAWDASKIELDISKFSECFYVENTLYVYTSRDMVVSATEKTTNLVAGAYKSMPYVFAQTDEPVLGTVEATSVILPYSNTDNTTFYYSETSEKYLYFKSGTRKVDMLNGKNISFSNIFILFSNATTYEKADGTELVIDTTSGGSGYYVSKGFLTEIRWHIDENGELAFVTLDGNKLTVNRGNAYVGYYKASNSSKVVTN